MNQKLLPNSIVPPPDLRTRTVVVINEYPPAGQLATGHIDLSFFFHGTFQGTYGRNSQGIDISGKRHPQGRINSITGSMPGGVFTETNVGSLPHFVSVSEKNYFSMFSYAQAEATLTAQGKGLDYNVLSGNCSDFAYRVFQHSDLPEKYRLINTYLRDHDEAVAIYSDDESYMYRDGSEKWSGGRRLAERGATILIDTERLKEKLRRQVLTGH